MATAQKITRDNFTTLLVRSTTSRTNTPNGNVYLDTTNDRIELITLSELATVDLGSGLEANPLTNVDKIQALALYFFILQEVQADPSLQNFTFSMDAVANRMGKLVGATSFLNGIDLAQGTVGATAIGGTLGDDRLKLADSGFTEFSLAGTTDAIYHGLKSLVDIDDGSQPFYQIAASLSESDRQAAAPVNFSKAGDINESIRTYLDGGADNLSDVLIIGVRDFGFSLGETSSVATGVTELGAYSQGYGVGNSPVAEIQALTQADVWGGAQVAPYTGLGFTRQTSASTETGYVEGSGLFTDKITNTGGASLLEIRAWLDMLMQQDSDQNDNTGSTGAFLPKRAEPLYTINSVGKLVTRQGLAIDNIPAADQQSVILTADDGSTRTFPIVTPVVIKLSTAWFTDTAGWFRLLYTDGSGGLDYDTASAVTVDDSASADVAGDNGDARLFAITGGYELRFSYAYDTNTQAGLSASADKTVTLNVGGTDATKSKSFEFVIGSSAVSVDASTDAETN